MTHPVTASGFKQVRTRAIAALWLGVASAVVLTACGSTKIYAPDKTVEYNGTIYNVSEVKQLSTRLEAVPASGNAVALKGYDSKQFEALVKDRGPMVVRSVISMDDKDLVYEQRTLQKGRDLSGMRGELDDAYKKLTRFMADGKKTQLKL